MALSKAAGVFAGAGGPQWEAQIERVMPDKGRALLSRWVIFSLLCPPNMHCQPHPDLLGRPCHHPWLFPAG